MSARPPGPVLLVEPDEQRGCQLAEQLAADGFAVELAHSVRHARILARTASPELTLLGGLDPPRGALALLQEIRATSPGEGPWNSRMGVIVAEARAAARELDVLRAFEAGADDFVAPSAGYLELRARVVAVLRRVCADAHAPGRLQVGPLTVDLHRRIARLHGCPLQLRRMEFELLAHLAREPERVFARSELLRTVWGYRAGCSTRTVDSHVSRLRRKLSADPARRWLVSVWGVGYRLL